MKLANKQGGIIFWICGILRDVPEISPENALMKNDDNDKICKICIFSKTDRKLYFEIRCPVPVKPTPEQGVEILVPD